MPRTETLTHGYVRTVTLAEKWQEWKLAPYKTASDYDCLTVRYPYTAAFHPRVGSYVVARANWSSAWEYEAVAHSYTEYRSKTHAQAHHVLD